MNKIFVNLCIFFYNIKKYYGAEQKIYAKNIIRDIDNESNNYVRK